MITPRRLLMLEDDPFFAELLRIDLCKQWPDCEFILVDNEKDFALALEKKDFDAILSDYALPGFSGKKALELARRTCPEIPFLFVSGAIGDEVAVESLKAGATDYVLKDRIARLAPAILRALSDVADNLSLERSIRRFEALVNSVDGIVWQADQPNLRFTFVSQQAERLLGYPVSCWIEQPKFWQAHIHPEDREKAIRFRSEITVGQGHQNIEYRMLAADGRVVWLRDMLSVRTEKDRTTQLEGIMVDITERKEAEENVASIRAKLEETNRDLLRKNQEIQNFHHTLSHELKTPLTSAREFVAIVLDRLAGPLNDIQSEYLSIARESCDQLGVCINDLLDATRLETGKLALELKHASLSVLVQRMVTTMHSKAHESKIALSYQAKPDLPAATLDEHRMTQVISNLLNNAFKHTPSGGEVRVEVAESLDQHGFLQVTVSDTGRGIPKEEQNRIFDRLYQVKAGDATTEQGIGLGLYLCRELIQLHGGNIWVESEPGKGSTFRFVVPKHQYAIRPNVLIIDGDSDVLDVISGALKEEYNVRTASDGAVALEEMQRQAPDVIVLDLAMANMDGLVTLERLKKNWDSIPIILHTANSGGDLMRQAMQCSPFTLLAKPCSVVQLRETVRKVLRSMDTVVWSRNHFGTQKPPLKNPLANSET